MKSYLTLAVLAIVGLGLLVEFETGAIRIWKLERELNANRKREKYLTFKLEIYSESFMRERRIELDQLNSLIANDPQIAKGHGRVAQSWAYEIGRTEARATELATLQNRISEKESKLRDLRR